jgi:predicted RNA polymerase sigma factor
MVAPTKRCESARPGPPSEGGSVPLGPYQVQAAIAAVHDEAPTADETDWPQILALYEVLEHVSPGPVIMLNRAVAVAMVHGP